MTTYTPHQIMQALGARGFAADAEDVAAIAQDLGLTLEQPKTKPGIYLHDDGRVFDLAYPGPNGTNVWYMPADSPWVAENRDKLTPARVVTDAEWSALVALRDAVDTIKATGGAVEIQGVKITPCDEYGRTENAARLSDGILAELVDDQIANTWASVQKSGWTFWAISFDIRMDVVATVNAALRKHGHATAMPDRDEVRAAIRNAYMGKTGSNTYDCLTDAVMALFPEGGKA